MSNDITLEAPLLTSAPTFADYARHDVGRVAQAVAVAVNHEATTTAALASSLRSVEQAWDEPYVRDDPDRAVFGFAIAYIITERARAAEARSDDDQPPVLSPLLGPACAVAYFGLGWSIDTIASTLQLSPEAVDAHVEQATKTGLAHHSASTELSVNVRSQIRLLLDEAEPVLPNAKRIAQRNRWGARLGRLRIYAGITAALLVGVVLLAQLVARPERIATDEPEPERASAPAAAATAERGTAVPPLDLVSAPQLITTDGNGGFIGVGSASAPISQAVFSRSTDGQVWTLAGRWDLGADSQITRFERSGDSYVIWIDGRTPSSDDSVGVVAVSSDLSSWRVVELSLNDESASGLIFDSSIANVSVSEDNILALVTTTVEIDFAALSLSEGYTCGQTITDDEVSVKLCNDAELDVLSLSDIAMLPERNRLFISREGGAFERADAPNDTETVEQLTTVNDAFMITTETGVRFTSRDASRWQQVAASRPPFPIRAAATDAANQIVGVGETADGNAALFHNDGRSPSTTVTEIADLVGEVSPLVSAVVATGSDLWVVYLFEPQTRAWLLTSPDGISWKPIATSPPIGDSPLLLVGDDEALVQWVDSDDATITLGVPLS